MNESLIVFTYDLKIIKFQIKIRVFLIKQIISQNFRFNRIFPYFVNLKIWHFATVEPFIVKIISELSYNYSKSVNLLTFLNFRLVSYPWNFNQHIASYRTSSSLKSKIELKTLNFLRHKILVQLNAITKNKKNK